jgi:sugar/nucleoside kinase (ribokinase family)
VALSLSDSFCVDRHRASFCQFVREHVDILFANEDEIKALYQRDAFEEAVSAAREDCTVAALTRGAQGAVVIAEGVQHEIGADAVHQVVDTTGAGDLFAAGFLYGYTHGLSPETSGCIGAAVAADIISQYGARPERSLREVAARHLP